MLIRSYIDKNNTIIKNTQINTGRNPIAEIYYGGKDTTADYTRHLLYFDSLLTTAPAALIPSL